MREMGYIDFVRRNADDVMLQMGYTDRYGDARCYPITPSFFKWLRQQGITGELPTKMRHAEILLKALIRPKEVELIRNTPQNMQFSDPEAHNGRKYSWAPLDLAILNMDLARVPDSNHKRNKFGKTYKLGWDMGVIIKYTRYIYSELDENRSPDLLGVLLLKDRFGILAANWGLFAGAFGGSSLDDWRGRLIA